MRTTLYFVLLSISIGNAVADDDVNSEVTETAAPTTLAQPSVIFGDNDGNCLAWITQCTESNCLSQNNCGAKLTQPSLRRSRRAINEYNRRWESEHPTEYATLMLRLYGVPNNIVVSEQRSQTKK